MSPEEARALQQRYYTECNKGQDAALAILEELFSPDAIWHSATGEELRDLENLRRSFTAAYHTFPDTHYTIDDMIVEGDKVVTRFTFTGTHQGAFRGIAPTHRRVTVWAIAIARFSGKKIAEVWERYDTMGWMRELGLHIQPGSERQ